MGKMNLSKFSTVNATSD